MSGGPYTTATATLPIPTDPNGPPMRWPCPTAPPPNPSPAVPRPRATNPHVAWAGRGVVNFFHNRRRGRFTDNNLFVVCCRRRRRHGTIARGIGGQRGEVALQPGRGLLETLHFGVEPGILLLQQAERLRFLGKL